MNNAARSELTSGVLLRDADLFLSQPAAWVDREEELRRLDELMRSEAGLAVVHGRPGTGKTALIMRWLATSGPDRAPLLYAAFPDRDQDAYPLVVLGAWLRQLGVPAIEIPADFLGRQRCFLDLTRERPVTVVIDNAMSAPHVRALLPGHPSSTVVVTSPRRISGLIVNGFVLLELTELPEVAAEQLLRTVYHQHTAHSPASRSAAAGDDGLAALARRCHGHPLMSWLALAYLVAHAHISPADLAEHLRHHPNDALTDDDRSLESLLTLAYDHLPELAQRVYRLLADHPGPDTPAGPLAEALGVREPAVAAALQQLHTAHLIDPRPDGRYALPRSVAPHAAHLRAQDPRETRDTHTARMLDWYATHAVAAARTLRPDAHRFSPRFTRTATRNLHDSPERARAWFDREHRCLLAVLCSAVPEHVDPAIDLAEAMWDLLRPTYHHLDLLRSQELGRTVAANVARYPMVAVFAARAAFAHTNLGEHDQARTVATEAIDVARDLGDSWLIAMALSTRARAHTAAGSPAAAIEDLTAALEHDRRRDDHRSIVLRHRRLGQAHLALGQHSAAIEHLRTAAELATDLGDDLSIARALTYLADALVMAGKPGEGLGIVVQTRPLIENSGSTRYLATVDIVAARAHHALGDCATARTLTDRVIERLREAGVGAIGELKAARTLRAQL